jgi:hypothetical protein
MPTTTILGMRIVDWTITKKTIFERIIIANKGTKGPTVVETNKKIEKILAELLLSWREGGCTCMGMERKRKVNM